MSPPASTRALPLGSALSRRAPRRDVAVLGWGNAVPRYRYAQAELAEFLAATLPPAEGRRLRAAFRGSRIRFRNSVLPDFAPGAERKLFQAGVVPTTARRMQVFAAEAPALAEAAARDALEASGLEPGDVTHLLFITCTGFAAPGPDREVLLRLGLSPSVRRVQIGYQGCSAGIVGLRTAAEIVRGEPTARVLVLATELASLHFQHDPGENDLRGHALFADGAGAAIVGTLEDGVGGEGARLHLGRGASRLVPDSVDHMTWDVGDFGFLMRLSSRVPEALTGALPGFLEALEPGGLEALTHWAVHPGGPVILDRVRETLGLDDDRLVVPREILGENGNMSSATIFFVLARLAERGGPGAGVALAFGPGLTVEGLRFRVVA